MTSIALLPRTDAPLRGTSRAASWAFQVLAAVILAIAGLAAALPGVVVMKTQLPVIGVPVPGGPLSGVDALLSISQLPGGVPATTVGLHSKAPMNAAMAAHRIMKLAEG